MNFKKISCLPAALLITLAALTLTTVPAWACGGGIICVDADAPGPAHDGLSWATAYTTMQDALDWTNAHTTTVHEIWAAEGVYYPDEGGAHVNDAVTETFLVAWNNVQLYGGFAATETLRTQRNWTLHPTVLSGDIDGNDWNTDTNRIAETWNDLVGNNAYHVLWLDGATNEYISNEIVLDGFVITAGYARGSGTNAGNGGGLYCGGQGQSQICKPTLAHILFSGNSAIRGGGMYSHANYYGKSTPILTDVIFSGNRASSGGGMYNFSFDNSTSNPVLVNVIFKGNSTSSGGGMVNIAWQNSTSNPSMTGVIFTGNSASNNGGGMVNFNYLNSTNSPSLTNVIFYGNRAAVGGGMVNESNDIGISSPRLTNVTFSGNHADNYGGGIVNESERRDMDHPTLTNCILWGNTAPDGPQLYNNKITPTVAYSDIQWPSGAYTGTGNLNMDPQFVAPIAAAFAPTATGDYRLRLTSPAIDAGNSFSVTAATDLDGNPRKVDLPDSANTGVGTPPVDMGAYEVQTPPLRLVKSVTPVNHVPYAGPVTYTLLLSNSGAETISGIVLTDTLPPQLIFGHWITQPAGATSDNDGIAWTGALGGGEVLTFTFRASQAGDYGQVITNTAEFSGLGQIGAASAAFTVMPNYPPALDPIGDRVILLGNSLTFNAAASDPNGYPPLDFTLDAGSVGSITGDGAFTWTPTDLGVYTATVRVSDGDMEDSETFSITVTTIYTLTVNNEGNGAVQRDPDQTGYISGTAVTLTAQPEAGWQFTAWSGDLSGATNPVTITMVADKAITATFDQAPANMAPQANAGSDRNVAPGAEAPLDGSASFDPDNHLPMAYLWQQTGGPAVSFTAALSRTTFVAPDTSTVLTFTLAVTDSLGLADPTPDTVVVTVTATPQHHVYLPLVIRGMP